MASLGPFVWIRPKANEVSCPRVMALAQNHQFPAEENTPHHGRMGPCLQGLHSHHRLGTSEHISTHQLITPVLDDTVTALRGKSAR